jgi:diguanylate cyclase (GGDEF)-like protein/PAS domain S-box-containing protein
MSEIKRLKTNIELVQKIPESQRVEKYWFQKQGLIQVVFQLIDDAVIIVDASGCLQFLNPAAEKLTGWSLQEVQSLPISTTVRIIDETTFEPLENFLEKVLPENQTIPEVNHRLLVGRDNNLFPVEQSTALIYGDDGEIVGAVLVFRSAKTPRDSADQQQSWQNSYDSLTGLIHRHSFEQCLEQAVSSGKNSEQNHILCYLDLDHFKIINETCGHSAGDEFLHQISAVLQKRVRKSDVLARLGGDEFGILLYHCDLEPALKVIHTLREEVKRFQFVWENKTFSFSLSVGIVLLKDNTEGTAGLLNLADSACEVAKSKGRNRVHIYQPNDAELIAQRGEIRWLPRIFAALEENRFLLYYQPISTLNPIQQIGRTNHVKYGEVLLRLKDEEGKIVPPGVFIPAAEKHGLMHLIDRWVISTLFAYLGRNKCKGEKSLEEHGNFSINLSGASLNDDQFFDFVEEQFALHSIPPQIICFEITETLAIANLNKASLLMHQIKTLGCSFALDDFGSGMSSFGYLKNLPIDYLKIDGIFIKDILQSPVAYEIVEAINRIAHVMGIGTVAEYVENNDILLKLKDMKIDYGQGYGIAKPAPLF